MEGFFIVLDKGKGNFTVVHGDRGKDMPFDVDGQWVFNISEGETAQARANTLNQTPAAVKERRAQLKQLTQAGREDGILNDMCVRLIGILGENAVYV